MKKGPHKMMLEPSRFEKWDRGGGGAPAVSGGGPGGSSTNAWAGRDRERDRERERQMRAHQMSLAHAPEPDASSLFPAPVRVTGRQDSVSRQIQTKLGDYHLAQSFIDDPSKSIGICAEPASPAPCHQPSRRESEFKKPSHAPQNGVRAHHQRPHVSHNKGDGGGSSGPVHRPPPLRMPNGVQSQNAIDSSQPPIESILKEMKSLPTPLSVIAATPRKEPDNKFIFNPYTYKVQEHPQSASNDLKAPPPKPGLDNRISNSRSSVSPSCDVVNKDLGLSESDDEVANTHAIGPPISPLGSASPSSGSSSQSEDSESESSSAESTAPAPAPAVPQPAPAPAPTQQRSSWSLSNFAPPPAHPPETYDSGKEIRHALADIKGKPESPISEMSDSEASSPSPGVVRRRRSIPNRVSTASSDEDMPRHSSTSTSQPSAPTKRGRPPKVRPSEERPPSKKPRGRPRKAPRPSPSPPHAVPEPVIDSDVEQDPPHSQLRDSKTHIFLRVFTPKSKNDEGGGKGGKGGKGKGGKGKGQVTIIERTPESCADEEARRHRARSVERRNEEALARVSPPQEVERRPERSERRREDRHERATERVPQSIDRVPDRTSERPSTDRLPERLTERTSHERIPTERTSNDRIPDRHTDRISTDRTSTDRTASERSSSASDRMSVDRSDRSGGPDRPSSERLSSDKMDRLAVPHERLATERNERVPSDKVSHDRHGDSKARLIDNKMLIDRLVDSKDAKMANDKLGADKTERTYVRAEADVGSGVKSGRGSERLEEASSVTERRRSRMLVRISLARLRPETRAALARPRRAPPKTTPTPHTDQSGEVAATNHERTEAYPGQAPIYFSYFERLPHDAETEGDRNHNSAEIEYKLLQSDIMGPESLKQPTKTSPSRSYLDEATRLRSAAERSQEPLPRVMLYLESVLCFVLTGRVLELELDTKGAFTIYRETIEYIKSIHSMPQRFRASPHDTFNKLDILSLRVQALLYLRMFKMYHREVKEYNKIVNEYQQRPALAESVSPLSPTPSPAGSVGSVGSGSASSGYCSLAHSVPAHAHQALLLLNKYYAFLYVAHDLWEQADTLCRLRANRDLFIAVDRKCGPLSLSSTFRHLVQYVRHAISLLKSAPRE